MDIYRILDSLSQSQYKRFKGYLSEGTLLCSIPWGLLEDADRTETVHQMMLHYGMERLLERTKHILRRLPCLNLLEQLEQSCQDFSSGSTNQIMRPAQLSVKSHFYPRLQKPLIPEHRAEIPENDYDSGYEDESEESDVDSLDNLDQDKQDEFILTDTISEGIHNNASRGRVVDAKYFTQPKSRVQSRNSVDFDEEYLDVGDLSGEEQKREATNENHTEVVETEEPCSKGCTPQLEQSAGDLKNSLMLQEKELVQHRGQPQHTTINLQQEKQVQELKGQIKDLKQVVEEHLKSCHPPACHPTGHERPPKCQYRNPMPHQYPMIHPTDQLHQDHQNSSVLGHQCTHSRPRVPTVGCKTLESDDSGCEEESEDFDVDSLNNVDKGIQNEFLLTDMIVEGMKNDASGRRVVNARCLMHTKSGVKIRCSVEFDHSHLASVINIKCCSCQIEPTFPQRLRNLKSQKIVHEKLVCRGRQQCDRGEDSKYSKRMRLKCYNCKGAHSVCYKRCPAYQQDVEVQEMSRFNPCPQPHCYPRLQKGRGQTVKSERGREMAESDSESGYEEESEDDVGELSDEEQKREATNENHTEVVETEEPCSKGCTPQLEQSAGDLKNSLMLQEKELVQHRGQPQHTTISLQQEKQVQELKGQIKDLKQVVEEHLKSCHPPACHPTGHERPPKCQYRNPMPHQYPMIHPTDQLHQDHQNSSVLGHQCTHSRPRVPTVGCKMLESDDSGCEEKSEDFDVDSLNNVDKGIQNEFLLTDMIVEGMKNDASGRRVVNAKCLMHTKSGVKIRCSVEFDHSHLASVINIKCCSCQVEPTFPLRLRNLKSQKIVHEKLVCRGRQQCDRGEDNKYSKRMRLKCYNCKGAHSVCYKRCPAYQQDVEVQEMSRFNPWPQPYCYPRLQKGRGRNVMSERGREMAESDSESGYEEGSEDDVGELSDEEQKREATNEHYTEVVETEEPSSKDCTPQLDQSASYLKNSLKIQEKELVQHKGQPQQTTIDLQQEKQVQALKGQVKDLKQDKDVGDELRLVRSRDEGMTSPRDKMKFKLHPSAPATPPGSTTPAPIEQSCPSRSPSQQAHASEDHHTNQEQAVLAKRAEAVILIDSNGNCINEEKLFPCQKAAKHWCSKTEEAFKLLNTKSLGEPRHIIINVETNDMRIQQENVAKSVMKVVEKTSETFSMSKIVISTILPRADFYPDTIKEVNAAISHGCAPLPNVLEAHHPMLGMHSLHDHVHLYKDTIKVFAKTLKDALALGQGPHKKASVGPQPSRPYFPGLQYKHNPTSRHYAENSKCHPTTINPAPQQSTPLRNTAQHTTSQGHHTAPQSSRTLITETTQSENMANMITIMYRLLDSLSKSDHKRFKEYLSQGTLGSYHPIPWPELENADTTDTEHRMKAHYGVRRLELTKHILKLLPRMDLIEELTQSSQDCCLHQSNSKVD